MLITLDFLESTDGINNHVDYDEPERTADVIQEDTNLVFEDFHLKPELLRGLADAGFRRPSPIQTKAIPPAVLGLDIIMQAKSGTGKTLVFSIAVLEAINLSEQFVQALVLAPTREVAYQSVKVIKQLASHMPQLQCSLFVGGVSLKEDLKALSKCHVAVGTPGRIKYLIEINVLNTSKITQFVLDEADILLGGEGSVIIPDKNSKEETLKLTGKNTFPAAINWIWWRLPENKQVIALSATYSKALVENHLPRYMRNPQVIQLASFDPSLLGVSQYFHIIKSDREHISPNAIFKAKLKFLCQLLSSVDFKQCMVFSNFHSVADDICKALENRGWPVMYISSNLSQNDRFNAYESLTSFQCRVLVSTDLTSRGVDASNVDLVISLEVPWRIETYLHRLGRAGRFGGLGVGIILVEENSELESFKNLISQIHKPIFQLPTLDKIPSNFTTITSKELVEETQQLKDVRDIFPRSISSCTKHLNKQRNFSKLLPEKTEISLDKNKTLPNKGIMEKCFELISKFSEMKNYSVFDENHEKLPENLKNCFNDYMNTDLEKILEQVKQDDVFTQSRTKSSIRTEKRSVNKLNNENLEERQSLNNKQRFFYNQYQELANWAEFYYSQYLHFSEELERAEAELYSMLNENGNS